LHELVLFGIDLGGELGRIQRDLDAIVKGPLGVADARRITRQAPLVRQIFLVGKDGGLSFPTDGPDASTAERDFLRNARAIFDGRSVLFEAPPAETSKLPGRRSDTMASLAAQDGAGWIRRFWEDGQQWLYWQRAESGVSGVHVERIAMLARLVAAVQPSDDPGRVILRDAKNAVIEQWGGPGDGAVIEELALAAPLDGLRVQYVSSRAQEDALLRASSRAEVASLAALCLMLMLAGAFVWREQGRALNDAQTRVSFVTQVSHELKTPLTNIRLYAELLERELPDDDARAQQHLQVITSESQRLSRLIDNVLSLSRERTLHLEATSADAVITRTLAQHRLSLEQRDFAIETTLAAGAPIRTDADALAQILANLFSNVEKYAQAGRFLSVTSEQRGDRVTVRVRDKGPGVPESAREKIFEPYVRLDDSITEGASGTGIGLSIARDLAKKLGGDLCCRAAEGGGAELVLTVQGAAA
jgi:signal transduction histidine kinase